MPHNANAVFVALVLSFSSSVAQDWGTTGSWQILNSPSSSPPSFTYRKPTSSAGCFFVLTNNSATGNMGVSQFDIINNVWTTLPDLPLTNPLLDPFMLDFSGFVEAIDELNPSNAVILDSVNNNGWKTLSLPGYASVSRFGQRFAPWGPLLFSFAGVEINTWSNHNDLWAIDFSSAVTSSSTASWVKVIDDGANGSPPARVGYSFTNFGLGLVMFGGASIDAGGSDPDLCFGLTTNSICHFHSTVWAFTPGLQGSNSLKPLSTSTWIKLPDGNGAQPSGRFDHTAAAMSNQLFIFGGTTALGTSNELWAYNLQTNTWAIVTATSASPSINTDIGYGAGVGIGRHLLQFVQSIDQTGNPLANTGQLWMWSPSSGSSSPSSGSGSSSNNITTSAGTIAGLVILTLLSLANLAFLILLYRGKAASAQSLGDVYSLSA